MNNEDRIRLRDDIEKLDKNNHLEILKILKKNNVKFSENKNGSFINLNYVNDSILNEIDNYINYVRNQENIINEFEIQKEEFANKFFIYNQQTPTNDGNFTFSNSDVTYNASDNNN